MIRKKANCLTICKDKYPAHHLRKDKIRIGLKFLLEKSIDMHTGKSYTLFEFLFWTRRNIFWLFLLGTIPTVLYQVFDCKWLSIPWPVVALLGTATAFIVGFKNLQTYNRTWEARQIWGAAMGASRSWAMMCRDFIEDVEKSRAIIYRHFAWLTALRHQLRAGRSWETTNKSYNKEYQQFYAIPERG